MSSVDQLMSALVGLTNRSWADFWAFVIVALTPVTVIGIFSIVLVGTRRSLTRRIESLESQLNGSSESTDPGPTVREFCRNLADSIHLRLPRAKLPATAGREDVEFIRGVLVHLKARRRHHVAVERAVELLRRDIATAREDINTLRTTLTQPASFGHAIAPPTDSATPDAVEIVCDPEFDALLTQASKFLGADTTALPDSVISSAPSADAACLAPSVEDSDVDEFLAQTIAAECPDTTEIVENAPPPVVENATAEPAVANTDAMINKLETLLEQAREVLDRHGAIGETLTRAESVTTKLGQLESRWTEQSASAAALLVRVDDRLDELQRLSESASAPDHPLPTAAESQAARVQINETDSKEPHSIQAEEIRKEADSIKAILAEAVLEGQRLEELRSDSSQTLKSLTDLDAALSQGLERRRDILERVDSQLRDRQSQLVTDILRAEAEHLELTESLKRIESSVQSIQGLIESVPAVRAPESEFISDAN